VPLAEQDATRWNRAAIDEAEKLLRCASVFGRIGRYQLEAAVQSVHAARRRSGCTDWPAIVQLYDALFALTASPVVAINRAVALAETQDVAKGLAALDAAAQDGALDDYQPYWAARAALLARRGDRIAADAAYAQAIGLESDPVLRRFLQQRRADLTA
jgi:RNA polymerase sigma-70 factor (ECF subfamily)